METGLWSLICFRQTRCAGMPLIIILRMEGIQYNRPYIAYTIDSILTSCRDRFQIAYSYKVNTFHISMLSEYRTDLCLKQVLVILVSRQKLFKRKWIRVSHKANPASCHFLNQMGYAQYSRLFTARKGYRNILWLSRINLDLDWRQTSDKYFLSVGLLLKILANTKTQC